MLNHKFKLIAIFGLLFFINNKCTNNLDFNEALNGLKAFVSGGIRQSNPAFAKATAGSPAIHPRDKSPGIMATENNQDNSSDRNIERIDKEFSETNTQCTKQILSSMCICLAIALPIIYFFTAKFNWDKHN